MPQQLIYTSAPQGLAAGRSGHCTVARSASMREPLVLRLEQLSYYQHLSLTGGQERPIFAYRIIDIRGSRFHVLSRIQDAGLDFTGRTNFVAHHLALAPEEFRQFPTPPIILRDWPGWAKSWTREPALFEKEDWSPLASLASKCSVPAQTWQRLTGDAVNGYGLLETRAGATFRVDDQTSETVLGLFAESIELLEVRDGRRDFRAAALQYTFTTSMQERDDPADFRWRCIHSDNPAANRFATPDCRALSAVRATKWTEEETAFARTGRQAPRFVAEPQDVRITEGDTARFLAKAEGIPNPTYQWFSVDRTDNGQPLPGETNPEVALANPALGKSRYVVRVANSAGDAMSRVATLSVDQKPRVAQTSVRIQERPPGSVHQKSASQIEIQRNRLEAEQAEKLFQRNQRRKRRLTIYSLMLAVVFIAIACVIFVNPTLRSNFKNHFAAILTSTNNSTNPPPAGVPPSPTPSPSTNNPPAMSASQTNNEEVTATNDPQVLGGFSSLPDGWRKMPISITNLYVEYVGYGRFDLSAAGLGFLTNGDSTLFVCKTNSGNAFTAILYTIYSGTPSSLFGIMVRESTNANSPFLFLGASSDKILVYLRSTDSASKGILSTNSVAWPDKLKSSSLFFKLEQNGKAFSPSFSFDGKDWDKTSFSGYDFYDLPSNGPAWVGFAVSSGSTSDRARVIISEAPQTVTNKKGRR
jgi:hypothetical protein